MQSEGNLGNPKKKLPLIRTMCYEVERFNWYRSSRVRGTPQIIFGLTFWLASVSKWCMILWLFHFNLQFSAFNKLNFHFIDLRVHDYAQNNMVYQHQILFQTVIHPDKIIKVIDINIINPLLGSRDLQSFLRVDRYCI